jgi:uridine phosphorylase
MMNEDESIVKPLDFIRYVSKTREVPLETIKVPERLLITYQRNTYDSAENLINGKPVGWWIYDEAQPFCIGQFNDVEIGHGRLWVGAPAAVMTLEEIIACGARTIFEIGLAGGLQEFLHPGDVIVVTEAIRDEGTSHHYFPPEVKVGSSERLRKRLLKCLDEKAIKHFSGTVWTTDGVYRETLTKFRKFKHAGVLAVNMETSAVLALAKYRNVEAVSVQVISDILAENGWLQAFEQQSVKENTETLLKAVLETLSKS